jgi:thiosulfate/3-mercaptopyruvate sulfurtransferase
MTVLISAEELAAALEADVSPRILDVRWTLAEPDGREAFAAGHIPGSVYVSLDDELAAHGEPTDGRHPLPPRDQLQEAARGWGLDNGDAVVVYDGDVGFAAARAWWLLRHAGIADVRILDGGLSAWIEQGGELAAGHEAPARGDVDLGWGAMAVVGHEDLHDYDGTLIDARAAERYRGETEPIDPKAGHIPGAISIPTAANVGQDGRFLSVADLAARFAELPAGPVAVYCGSGVSAAQEIAALEMVGRTAALYPGSWSQWSNLDLPVETGTTR